ncbi:MAG TPA: hypothetical protein VJ063_08045, partial [Verrucomicrobiae bacterium]|nr:hypothetical protein [Verrucomicrobiae bacterium]
AITTSSSIRVKPLTGREVHFIILNQLIVCERQFLLFFPYGCQPQSERFFIEQPGCHVTEALKTIGKWQVERVILAKCVGFSTQCAWNSRGSVNP